MENRAAEIEATLDRLDREDFPRRFWQCDASLWKTGPEHQRIIRNALGWLNVIDRMRPHLTAILEFVEEVRGAGFRHAVVLGMGGSSLCPDVCRATFGTAPGFLELRVLDSTVPASVLSVAESLDLSRALFLVSSKSGGTVETLSAFKYFYGPVRNLKGERAGENFVAITDPGTSLEKLAREKSFRRVFQGEADIGGRYSALSNFGLVPAALAGVDVTGLLERAAAIASACGPNVPAPENPAIRLGATLAQAALAGKDKITFIVSPGIATFADWAEQLIAESTGKEGKGLVPVAGEPLGEPEAYGDDRAFFHMTLSSERNDAIERKLTLLEAAGHPVTRTNLQTKLDLGREFFLWEMAVATAGALLGINAFDQPNVQESKDNTNRLLSQLKTEAGRPEQPPLFETADVQIYARQPGSFTKGLEGFVSSYLAQARRGDYVALMAYLDRSKEHDSLLQEMRLWIRDSLKLATTLGYGPRFLHSTGQLHKGGPDSGLFLQITSEDQRDAPIPGEPYTFSSLKRAQALGDLESLQSKGRRVARFHLQREVRKGLERLADAIHRSVRSVGQVGAR